MLASAKVPPRLAVALVSVAVALACFFVIYGPGPGEARQQQAEPWSASEILRPADLASQLSQKAAKTPTIVYVGFRTLFEGGHVPGAKFYGTASTEKGLADLKAALASLPRSGDLIIYCGCCPFEKCPNIRPAYKALREMGFSRMRVLVLPTSFAVDWVEKGFPIEKGL
jgi:thiosulfate/3-mercaptopyruvate sulfurtransferase